MDDSSVFPAPRRARRRSCRRRALVRREVFERVRFYDGFPVNGYREETDFFVQAARVGLPLPADRRDLLLPARHLGRRPAPLLAAALRVLGAAQQLALPAPPRCRGCAHRVTSRAAASAQLRFASASGPDGRLGSGAGAHRASPQRGRRGWPRQRRPGTPLTAPDAPCGASSHPTCQTPRAASSACACCWHAYSSSRAGGATIVGPQREATRWQFRLALGPLAALTLGDAARRGHRHPDLLITNGYLGRSATAGGGLPASTSTTAPPSAAVRAVGLTGAARTHPPRCRLRGRRGAVGSRSEGRGLRVELGRGGGAALLPGAGRDGDHQRDRH